MNLKYISFQQRRYFSLKNLINCDKILVFDNGQIISEGSHEFLVNSSPIYKNLYEKQIIN